jgi:transposase
MILCSTILLKEDSDMSSYTKDFKRDALRYIDEHPDMKIKDVASYLGIPVGTLYDWHKRRGRSQILGDDSQVSGPMTPEEKEIARLKRENRDLKDALDILKKAISILND